MTMLIPLAATAPGSRTECLKRRWFTMRWGRWLLTTWLEAPLKLMGSVMTFDGAEMNYPPIPSEADE